jgi:hypothetical protein
MGAGHSELEERWGKEARLRGEGRRAAVAERQTERPLMCSRSGCLHSADVCLAV